MAYNNDDYQPSSGKVIKSDGTVVNEGDGYNVDGSQNEVIVGSKIVGPTKIGTWSYTTFGASSTNFPSVQGILNRNATHRTFFFNNSMDQAPSTLSIIPWDSSLGNGNSAGGDSASFSLPAANGGKSLRTSEVSGNAALSAHVDSLTVSVGMGTTAPTKGTLDLWVVEILGT